MQICILYDFGYARMRMDQDLSYIVPNLQHLIYYSKYLWRTELGQLTESAASVYSDVFWTFLCSFNENIIKIKSMEFFFGGGYFNFFTSSPKVINSRTDRRWQKQKIYWTLREGVQVLSNLHGQYIGHCGRVSRCWATFTAILKGLFTKKSKFICWFCWVWGYLLYRSHVKCHPRVYYIYFPIQKA